MHYLLISKDANFCSSIPAVPRCKFQFLGVSRIPQPQSVYLIIPPSSFRMQQRSFHRNQAFPTMLSQHFPRCTGINYKRFLGYSVIWSQLSSPCHTFISIPPFSCISSTSSLFDYPITICLLLPLPSLSFTSDQFR